MNPAAHLSSVTALRKFQGVLSGFRHEVQGHLAKAAEVGNRVLDQLDWAHRQAVHEIATWRVRLEEAARRLDSCLNRPPRENDHYACDYERREVEEAVAELARCEAKEIALRSALARLSAAAEVFRVERACLDHVLDVDLTQGDQHLRMKLLAIEGYIFAAHSR